MAHAAFMDMQALEDIALQVGELIGDVAEPALLNAQPIELRETFEVWTLGLDALIYGASTRTSLTKLAYQIGWWHHQITFAANPAAFARSSVSLEGKHTLEELFVSPLATRIDQAINWIDQNVAEDALVSLLTVPVYYLHALWLTDDVSQSSRVLVVDAAGMAGSSGYAGNTLHGLQTNQFYEASTFIQTLAQSTPPIGVLLGASNRSMPVPATVP